MIAGVVAETLAACTVALGQRVLSAQRQKRTLVYGAADFDDCQPRTKCGTKRSAQAAIAVSGW